MEPFDRLYFLLFLPPHPFYGGLTKADDVMDESITRRGQPCWYRIPKVQS